MELIDFDKQCIELLESLPKWHSRSCFRGALNHIELAEKLYPIDSSMGVFRYITAEEEAASGLMRCLQEIGYINAEKLQPRNHIHKHAVIPFFTVISQFMTDRFGELGIAVELFMVDENKQKKIRLEATLELNEISTRIRPDPPLNFSFLHENKRFSYKPQIDTLVQTKGVKEINKHFTKIANLRNQLLYASSEGYPAQVTVEPKFFPAYQNRIIAMLRAYLLIAPYREPLSFVQDSLDAFLTMMGTLKIEDIHTDY